MIAVIGLGCSSNPGRRATYDDAAVSADTSFDPARLDARIPEPDAGFLYADAGSFADASTPLSADFSGVWSMFDQSSDLYAREVASRLSLIVGGFPYVYTGTISASGQFELTSLTLALSGCENPKIEGSFNRQNGFYTLTHQSCDSQLSPFSTSIRGSFKSWFEESRSGVYELTSQIVFDYDGCLGGISGPSLARYGVSVDSITRQVAVFTAQGVSDVPFVYLGRYSPQDDGISATHTPAVGATEGVTSFQAQFLQANANSPPQLTGFRDFIDPVTLCRYRAQFEGQRILWP